MMAAMKSATSSSISVKPRERMLLRALWRGLWRGRLLRRWGRRRVAQCARTGRPDSAGIARTRGTATGTDPPEPRKRLRSPVGQVAVGCTHGVTLHTAHGSEPAVVLVGLDVARTHLDVDAHDTGNLGGRDLLAPVPF